MTLASDRYGINEPPLAESQLAGATMVAFTAQTRMSGVDLEDGRQIRKGAADSVRRWVEDNGGSVSPEVGAAVDAIADQGGTPLVVASASAPTSLPPHGSRS